MCTVSVCQQSGQLILSMNRDERRHRHEGQLCFQESNSIFQSAAKPSIVYPTDKPTGGTWCGFNNEGVVMALLNRYQDTNPSLKDNNSIASSAIISRGSIIPTALSFGQFDHVARHLENQCYKNRQPFDLVLASPNVIRLYSWTGSHFGYQDKSENMLDSAWMISSSSVNAEHILPTRQQRFDAWLSKDRLKNQFMAGIMPQFHLERTEDASESVYMSRELSHTKSFMQIVVDFECDDELKSHNKLTKICGYYLHESLLLKRQVKTNQAYKFSSDETFLLLESLNESLT